VIAQQILYAEFVMKVAGTTTHLRRFDGDDPNFILGGFSSPWRFPQVCQRFDKEQGGDNGVKKLSNQTASSVLSACKNDLSNKVIGPKMSLLMVVRLFL